MEKIIEIGNKQVKLNNNVAWTLEYRDQFGRDIVPALLPILATITEGMAAIAAEAGTADGTLDATKLAEAFEGRTMDILLPLYQTEFVDSIVSVVWAMAKAADEDIDPPKQWVRQFDEFPVDIVAPAVYELVMKGFVSSKNRKRLKNLVAKAKALQPLSTISSSQALNEA